MRWRFLVPTIFVAVLIALSLVAGISRPAFAQDGAPATRNIAIRDGVNPGEVVVSWDAVPQATHYRIGYVNMIQDYPLAKASVTGEWIEAFVYVDVNARNFTESGGRVAYTLRRLAQGDRHAFTVLTSSDHVNTEESFNSEFSWPVPASERWKFHVVADLGGACPTVGIAAASADVGGAASQGAGTTAANASEGGSTGQEDSDTDQDVPFERRHVTLASPTMGELTGDPGTRHSAGQMAGARVTAQTSAPATRNIAIRDGVNPGEVVVSWDAVPQATHYRIGYVNMIQDYPLAKASVTGEWIEAFVYVDVNARNFTESGGRVAYTLRRLAQGDRHAFTVLTSSDHVNTEESFNSEFSWPVPASERWKFHVVADLGGACPTIAVPIVTQPVVITSLAGLQHGTWLEQNRPQAAIAIRALPWVGDGITGSELQAAEALIAAARWYPSVFSFLMQVSWVGDGVTDAEAIAIERLRWTARYNSQLADGMLQKSWVQDAINIDEANVLRNLYWIMRLPDSEIARQQLSEAEADILRPQLSAAVVRILAMPFLDQVASTDAAAVASLDRYSGLSNRDFLGIMSHPRLNDGITDEEAKIVLLLGATYQFGAPGLVETLLDPTQINVEERSIRLPHSGNVDLAIIRTAPGPARTMNLLEHSVRVVEEFMETPFPTNHVAVLVEDAVVGGGTNYGTHITILPEDDVDDDSREALGLPSLMTHEISHYYWTGNEEWIDEGAANSMEFTVEKANAGRPVVANSYPCPYFSSLDELVRADILHPGRGGTFDEFRCNYSLGERIFLDMYRSLGDAAFRRGFSYLYRSSQVLDENLWPTELNVSHFREAFLPIAPAASTIVARWYDGTEPWDLSHLDTGPVDPSLPAINGRITEASLVFESDWPDGPGISRFSASGIGDQWLILRLRLTFPRTTAPKVQPLEYVEYYEDGFTFRQRVRTLSFDPDWIRARSGTSVGLSPSVKWATGRYWVYVYDGDRKVAEVTYEVTP